MHPAWWDFDAFYRDFGATKPDGSLSIDRVNNDDGYWHGNVRWATAKEQANNRRTPQRAHLRKRQPRDALPADQLDELGALYRRTWAAA